MKKDRIVSWKISKSSVADLAYLHQFQYLSNLKLCNNATHLYGSKSASKIKEKRTYKYANKNLIF